jgi:subtilisin
LAAPTDVTNQRKKKKDKNDMTPDQSNQHSATESSSQSRSSGGTATRTAPAAPQGKPLGAGKRQFLIATLDFPPVGLEMLEQNLKSMPEIEWLDGARSRGIPGANDVPNFLVVRMPEEKAEALRQQSRGRLIVEPDRLLHLAHFDPGPGMVTGIAAAVGPELSLTILVTAKDNAPVKEAEVYLFGCLDTASGLTDERGQVTLSLSGETIQSIRSIYVKPKSDYWTFYQEQPALDASQPNVVYLRVLSETFPNFPRQQVLGWGQRLMRLDQLPPDYRGKGVKVGIIDSGVATSHVDLQRIKSGVDVLRKNGATSWNQDTVSHGSHCAGIIAAAENSLGIRGFAPESEIHVCKIFPGGRLSHLSEALEYCIENQIDVATLNLSSMERSDALDQQILRAKRLGVALIAAAGNSGGPVEFPASSRHALAVSAIGKWGEFPPESYHSHMLAAIDANGLFSPKFTCFGPEIALCGPGVAILSCVPPNNYAVRDGTSLAAAHVAGVAALVLAHHPDFQGPFRARTADRVERLFQILRASAQPIQFGDPRRTGFGLPDVLVALGLAPGLVNLFSARAAWLSGIAQQNAFNPYAPAPLGFGMAPAYALAATAGRW